MTSVFMVTESRREGDAVGLVHAIALPLRGAFHTPRGPPLSVSEMCRAGRPSITSPAPSRNRIVIICRHPTPGRLSSTLFKIPEDTCGRRWGYQLRQYDGVRVKPLASSTASSTL